MYRISYKILLCSQLKTLTIVPSFLSADIVIQHEAATRLLAQLDFIQIKPKTIWQLGNDTAFADLLHQRFPKAKIATSTSKKLQKIDLVISSGYLHRVTDLPTLLATIQHALKPDGLLLFNCLGPDTLQAYRTGASPFIDMHNIGDMLVKQHFADAVVNMEHLTVTYQNADEGWQALATLEENFGNITHQPNTPFVFELIYGHAWRGKPPGQTTEADGTVYVDINALLQNRNT